MSDFFSSYFAQHMCETMAAAGLKAQTKDKLMLKGTLSRNFRPPSFSQNSKLPLFFLIKQIRKS
jgi:hypothetical protein